MHTTLYLGNKKGKKTNKLTPMINPAKQLGDGFIVNYMYIYIYVYIYYFQFLNFKNTFKKLVQLWEQRILSFSLCLVS